MQCRWWLKPGSTSLPLPQTQNAPSNGASVVCNQEGGIAAVSP